MEPTNMEDARAILGPDLLDLTAVRDLFHIRVSALLRTSLRHIPFGRGMLEERKSTHILFAGVPLSILDLRRRTDHRLFKRPFWYARDPFARNETVQLRWYLLRKDVVPGSKGKTFVSQASLLADHEQVPRACEVVYGVLLYFLARGIRLFADTSARCSDIAQSEVLLEGARIDVGTFSETGFSIALWDDRPDENIGIASMVMTDRNEGLKPLQR